MGGAAQAGKVAPVGRNARHAVLSQDGANVAASPDSAKPPIMGMRNAARAQHASLSRVLSISEKEAGYARQLKQGAKQVQAIQQEIDQTKAKMKDMDGQIERVQLELKSAEEVSKL